MKSKIKKNDEKVLVLYHKNCPDGFGAAYSAWKKFGNKAEYVAVEPETLPEKFPKNREIYALDISYPVTVQERLRAKNKSLVVLDHHISKKLNTEAFPENIFDNNHSGAVLAWKYFRPKKKIPKLLLHIEDIDLWKWRFLRTREIISALEFLEFDFEEWDRFVSNLEDAKKRKGIVTKGRLIVQYEERLIGFLIQNATLVKFEGIKMLAVNSPLFNSEVGHKLTEKLPPVGMVWYEDGGVLRVSLRADGKVDVSKIAAKYGGGGHKNAAGFTWPLSPSSFNFGRAGKKVFPWKIIKNNF